jgi:predicted acyltransferase
MNENIAFSPITQTENECNVQKLGSSIDSSRKPRFLSIDVFRGITIFVMVFVNFVDAYHNTPSWSRHAPDIGLTYVDLVAPFFIFAITLTYHSSFISSQKKSGNIETWLKFIRRYAAIMGIGLLAGITFTPDATIFYWSALPSIGLAGIFTLLFIRFSLRIRLAISIIALIIYQIAMQNVIEIDGVSILISDLNISDVHGGFTGGFGFAIMMLLGTVICEGFERKKMSYFYISGIIFTTLGIVTHFIWGISKNRVSLPYIFISLGTAAIFFYFVWILYDKLQIIHNSSRFFQPIGKNSLFLYLIHGLFQLILQIFIPFDIMWPLVILSGLLASCLTFFLAYHLDKRKIYLIL